MLNKHAKVKIDASYRSVGARQFGAEPISLLLKSIIFQAWLFQLIHAP